jgi:hypothetical protein
MASEAIPQQFSSKSLWVFLCDFLVLLAISCRSLMQLQASCLNPCMPLLLVVQRGAANVPWLARLLAFLVVQEPDAAGGCVDGQRNDESRQNQTSSIQGSSTIIYCGFRDFGGIRTCDRPFTII